MSEDTEWTGATFTGYRLINDGKTLRQIRTKSKNKQRLKTPVPNWGDKDVYYHPMDRDQISRLVKDAIRYKVSLGGCKIEKFSQVSGHKSITTLTGNKNRQESTSWTEYTTLKTSLTMEKLIKDAEAELLVEKLKGPTT